jgi:hypothetical protein
MLLVFFSFFRVQFFVGLKHHFMCLNQFQKWWNVSGEGQNVGLTFPNV